MTNYYPVGSKFHFFYYTDSPFSQFYPSPIKGISHIIANPFNESKELHFETSEKWMHYYKAILFGDSVNAAKILESTHPGVAKDLGRRVKGFKQDEWDKHKVQIVLEGNILKFTQNAEMRAAILEITDKYFVEASPTDKIWGIGMRAHCTDPSQWKGANLLGKVLDKTRNYVLSH